MSLQEVEQAGRAAEAARTTLKDACVRAVNAGVPQAAVARAGGIHRNTVRSWVSEGSDRVKEQA